MPCVLRAIPYFLYGANAVLKTRMIDVVRFPDELSDIDSGMLYVFEALWRQL